LALQGAPAEEFEYLVKPLSNRELTGMLKNVAEKWLFDG
jgi:hypothetical protein